MRFTDKVVVVTGGTRGIGKAVSKLFARNGAKLSVVSRRPESADAALEEFKEDGLEVNNIIANIGDEDQVRKMIKKVVDEYGKIDILVNNAGIAKDNLLIRMKSEDWNDVLQINLSGAFHCIKAVSKYMLKARYGRIINVTSVVGISGNAGQANYSASKAGLIGLTKSTAKELASRNITVNAVAPGYIETDMTDGLGTDAKNSFLQNIPLNRPGTPEDVAKLICFLASDDASYITGQTINVDGGMLM